jgi:signal transduction histidine kinase
VHTTDSGSRVAAVPARPVDAPLVASFDRAVARVRDSADRLDAARAEDFRRATDAIAAMVRAVTGGVVAHPPVLPRNAPGRRILESLRKELLNELSVLDDENYSARAPRGANDRGLPFLQAIEAVQDTLDGDAAQRFASRLSGPDALQLLVEVSHDMRSPLNAILFLTEQIRHGRSGAVAPLQARQMGLVYGAAFGLNTMVSDVIELAHAGNRLVEGPPAPFSVSSVLDGVYDIVRPLAEEKSVSLHLEAPDADLRIGHGVALSRVLLNLTTNAVKFTEQGSVLISCASVSRTAVKFAVQDTGRGIPPAVLATLFDAFRQHHVSGEFVFSSAGLGLSICQRLVRAMGAEITVETELGSGTRFSFALNLPIAPRVSGPVW